MHLIDRKVTKYLIFRKYEQLGKKTYHIEVTSKTKSDELLGIIKWYSHWRRYVLTTIDGIIFDVFLLNEITYYINDLMNKKKINPPLPAIGKSLVTTPGLYHDMSSINLFNRRKKNEI